MTRIGLLSDPHGRAAITRRAVAALLAQGVDTLLCLGDVGSTQVIDELVVNQSGTGEQIPVRLVFGNTDMDAVALGRYAQGIGVQVDHPAGRLTLDRGVLVFCHGP